MPYIYSVGVGEGVLRLGLGVCLTLIVHYLCIYTYAKCHICHICIYSLGVGVGVGVGEGAWAGRGGWAEGLAMGSRRG